MAYSLQGDVVRALGPAAAPPALQGFDARPILSVGTRASSTKSHAHAETWQLLLAGLKAWWLGKPGVDLDEQLGTDPCASLLSAEASRGDKRSKEPWLCVQRPGEVLYFGKQMPHATCNLRRFVLGLGAQGRSETWTSKLHIAAHRNDTVALQQIIEEDGELDIIDQDGQTALHRAAAMGHFASVALMVSAGADLRLKEREGKNAAAMAAERGDLKLLRFLADSGASVKRKDGGRPHAVHWAALSGHRPVLEFLFAQGASSQAKDEKGTEPLHWAALESDVQTVAFLVESAGVNVSATGRNGEVPLHWAAGVGHAGIVRYLIDAQADPNAADARGTTALHFASAQDRIDAASELLSRTRSVAALLSAEATGGVQPLHAAAAQGHVRLVKLLLAARASPDSRDANHRTAADLAKVAGRPAVHEVLRSHAHQEDL